jgi:hypothetical protein
LFGLSLDEFVGNPIGGLAGSRRTSTCFLLKDLSGGGSGAFSAKNKLYIGLIDL